MLNTDQSGFLTSFTRWLSAVPFAASMTLGLVILMYKLVFMEKVTLNTEPTLVIPQVTWTDPEPIETRIKKLHPPKKIEPPPAVPETVVDSVDNPTIRFPKGKIKLPKQQRVGFDPSLPIAQFLVSPNYPGRALTKGVEGYVLVGFDVNTTGATENIVVLEAEPKGYFEKAAMAAAKRWKFQPKREAGKPVVFRGMSHRVTFEISS